MAIRINALTVGRVIAATAVAVIWCAPNAPGTFGVRMAFWGYCKQPGRKEGRGTRRTMGDLSAHCLLKRRVSDFSARSSARKEEAEEYGTMGGYGAHRP